MKLVGIVVVLVGWAVAVLGLSMSQSVGVRMVMALVGIVICLVGILGVLNKAHMKTANWKL